MKNLRLWMAGMALSASALVGIVSNEGYTDQAVQPVKNDQWTYGYGSTTRPDGKPVQPGDKITPPQALKLTARDIAVKEAALRTCFGDVTLTQGEYDAYVDLAYNVGAGAVCRSSIPQKVRRGEYAAACRTILDFKKVQGRDCSLPQNKRFCGGVWERRLRNFKQCMGDEACPLRFPRNVCAWRSWKSAKTWRNRPSGASALRPGRMASAGHR